MRSSNGGSISSYQPGFVALRHVPVRHVEVQHVPVQRADEEQRVPVQLVAAQALHERHIIGFASARSRTHAPYPDQRRDPVEAADDLPAARLEARAFSEATECLGVNCPASSDVCDTCPHRHAMKF